jgi:hypothetical protein
VEVAAVVVEVVAEEGVVVPQMVEEAAVDRQTRASGHENR